MGSPLLNTEKVRELNSLPYTGIRRKCLNMAIYKHKNRRYYNLEYVTPRSYTGSWIEATDRITGEVKRLNNSSWKLEDFKPVSSEDNFRRFKDFLAYWCPPKRKVCKTCGR